MKQQLFKRCMTTFINVVFYACMALCAWLLLQVVVFATFKIPTQSMMPTLQPGDEIVVNKLYFGARLFNLSKALGGETFTVYRMPGLSSIKRNDIVVFNYPYPKTRKRMEMDMMQYYVKRCVALPGDSISIADGFYQVAGCEEVLGHFDNQRALSLFVADIERRDTAPKGYKAFYGWNIGHWGPFYVPQAGDSLSFDYPTARRYRQCIEWELGQKLEEKEHLFYLDGVPLHGYRFRNNYYFMAGDNCMDSKDSRYWGLVPEAFIVGKASMICYSQDPDTGRFLWARFMRLLD